MAKLIVTLDGALLGHYFIDKDKFVVGRKADSDIRLDDTGVSKEHILIRTVGNDQVLEDCGSTNGTNVNGVRVNKHILQNNDVIELGPFRLKYVNQRATREMDFDKTLMLSNSPWQDNRGPDTKMQLATAVSSARAVRASFPLGCVRGLKGPNQGERIVLDRVLKTFGQRGGQLAAIMRRPHGYYLMHVEGRRQPRVNGKSIGTDSYPLQDNDTIEIGAERLLFSLK